MLPSPKNLGCNLFGSRSALALALAVALGVAGVLFYWGVCQCAGEAGQRMEVVGYVLGYSFLFLGFF